MTSRSRQSGNFHRAARLWFRPVSIRRLHSQQIAYEEVVLPPLAVRAADAVAGAGDDDEVEIFASFDQRIGQAERRFPAAR